MGAVAPPLPSQWLPEDDVLLKNAVEAGASLESLAKGAVQFSQRFTVQQLQDRWYTLLYDPVVSEEASAHMIEVERSGLINQWRPIKLEGAKETSCSSGKRKAESIRKSYYSMRKRICNDPFDMIGINLLPGPSNSNLGNINEVLSADCRIGNPITNNLGIQGPDFDIRHHSFPEFGPHAAPFAGVQNHGQDLQFGGKSISQNLPCPYEENNLSLTGDVTGFGQSQEMSFSNLFEAEGLANEENAYSEFGDAPFRMPQMPIWSTSTDIPVEGLPNIHNGEGDQLTANASLIPQTGNDINETEAALRFGGAPSTSTLKSPLSCDKDSVLNLPSTSAVDYYVELSNTLFDFTTDDEFLFLDTDGKDPIDKSYLDGFSSLLLDSPNHSELPGEAPVAADGQLVDESGPDNRGLSLSYQHRIPDVQVASSPPSSMVKGFGPEYRNGVISCTLNTEDPEVPSNDDVFLPFRFPSPSRSSGPQGGMQDPSHLLALPVKDSSSNRKPNGVKNNQKDMGGAPPRVVGPSQLSDMGTKYQIGDRGIKFELPKSNIQNVAPRNAIKSECATGIGASTSVRGGNFVGGVFKEAANGIDNNLDYNRSVGPCIDKNDSALDILQGLQKNAGGSRNGLDAKTAIPNTGSSDIDSNCPKIVDPKPVGTSPDQEETWSESDFDVPYFSDVEAMILDMDLSPDESDLQNNPEVQRYQHEETKRTIMRLEQGAAACTQRIIAAQGALAVLYGRRSKHFIKKSEVLIGRSTEDVNVDIDLGRERNGGKISRRQAVIKMDMHGMFHLKNLGKCAIHLNGAGVASGQSEQLDSGCLVEIRGLAFVFETNHTQVKQQVDSIAQGS